MLPVIVGIIGYSNSGKTTLIEYLVKNFRKDGYKVGTIKHASHGFEVDKIGSDSYRHRKAGAEIVCLHSKKDSVVFRKFHNAISPEYLYNTFLKEMDIILVEGFRKMKIPHIEVFREGVSSQQMIKLDDAYKFARFDISEQSEKKKVYNLISELVALHKNVSVGILAGGAGKRIGGNKPMKKICGVALLEFVYKKFEGLSEDVFIVTRKDVKIPNLDCRITYDVARYKKRAPLIGIVTALRYAKYENILIVACDLPLINEELIRLLLMKKVLQNDCDVVVPLNKKKLEPLCALYSKNSSCIFEQIIDRSLGIVNAYNNCDLNKFEVPESLEYTLFNVNSKEGIRKAEQIIFKMDLWHT